MKKVISRRIPEKVDSYYRELSRKYFYTVYFIFTEAAAALENGITIDQHLASEETRQRAIKSGNYEPQPFEFNNVSMSHNKMTTLMLCYRVINRTEFVGSIVAFHRALPYTHKGVTNFSRHIEALLDVGWLEVEYIAINPAKPVGRGNIQGRYTMPAIADDIVNHVVKTGYRL